MRIHEEITIAGQEARHGDVPAWLADSPVWPAVQAQTGEGQLYLHQAMGLELLGQGHNVAISTGTASGKSLVFQAPTLHHLAIHPNATAIAIYPIKALARDQVVRWQRLAEAAGLDPSGINKIDGDVRDLTERRQILQRTRLALMTPDVIQQWLMAYSEPLYHRRPLRDDLREVQNTQYNVRRFLSNLAFLIIDEAHTYDGALGTHCLYLLHRLQQKRRELMAEFSPLRVIAASATIHNPAQHLETLTGLPFQVVDDRYNGSPRAELTVQHVVGREPHDEGWRDLQVAVREVINEHPDQSYIAFVDDRQLAERAAAGIEAARSITEDAIIVESRYAMAYRSGLMRRERIEEALRAGDIRGIASTSAMELGIDIPDLQVGFNLGLPHSVGRIRQRAGRVGRNSPGRFIIVAPRHAFQFHEDSFETYWRQPVEPARLYPNNPNIKNTHGRCLAKETDLNGMERSIPSPTDAWPEQLPQTLREIARGDHYAPEFQTGDPQQPHRNDIRDAADGRARIVQAISGGETELLTSEVSRREAARDAYPLATYYHAKQSYSIEGWRESGGETVITARHAPPRETRPIIQGGATVTLQQPRASNDGHLEYCAHAQAVAWEQIVGCSVREPGDAEWRNIQYGTEGIPEVVSNLRTTATVIIIWEDWFDDANTRRDVARALKTVMCSRESIHPADIRHHPPERPGGPRRPQQRGKPRRRHLGQGGRRAGVVEGCRRQPGPVHPGAAGDRPAAGTALGKRPAAEGRYRGHAAPLGGHRCAPYPGPDADPHHHGIRWHGVSQPAGGQVGDVLRPAGNPLGVRAGPARRLDARLSHRAGRGGGLRRGQAGGRVPHGRGPTVIEFRLGRRRAHPGPGTAPRLALPGRRLDPT